MLTWCAPSSSCAPALDQPQPSMPPRCPQASALPSLPAEPPASWEGTRGRWPSTGSWSTWVGTLTRTLGTSTAESPEPTTFPSLWGNFLRRCCLWFWWRTIRRCRPSPMMTTSGQGGRSRVKAWWSVCRSWTLCGCCCSRVLSTLCTATMGPASPSLVTSCTLTSPRPATWLITCPRVRRTPAVPLRPTPRSEVRCRCSFSLHSLWRGPPPWWASAGGSRRSRRCLLTWSTSTSVAILTKPQACSRATFQAHTFLPSPWGSTPEGLCQWSWWPGRERCRPWCSTRIRPRGGRCRARVCCCLSRRGTECGCTVSRMSVMLFTATRAGTPHFLASWCILKQRRSLLSPHWTELYYSVSNCLFNMSKKFHLCNVVLICFKRKS